MQSEAAEDGFLPDTSPTEEDCHPAGGKRKGDKLSSNRQVSNQVVISPSNVEVPALTIKLRVLEEGEDQWKEGEKESQTGGQFR